MRAGTQTLIQALQALPWMAGSDDENIDPGVAESESEDEDRPECEIPASRSDFCVKPFQWSDYHHPFILSIGLWRD